MHARVDRAFVVIFLFGTFGLGPWLLYEDVCGCFTRTFVVALQECTDLCQIETWCSSPNPNSPHQEIFREQEAKLYQSTLKMAIGSRLTDFGT